MKTEDLFDTYAEFSEEVTFLTAKYALMCAYHVVRNVSFSENSAYVRNL